MFKTILKFAGAPVAVAAFLLFGTERGRTLTRQAVKGAVKGGVLLGDKCKEAFDQAQDKASTLIADCKESADVIIAEVKEERKAES